MEIAKLSETVLSKNYGNDTIKISFKNGDTIITNKKYNNTKQISILTNKNTCVIKDSFKDLIALHELQHNEILFSHFLFNSETKTLTDLFSLRLSHFDDVTIEESHRDPFVKLFNNEIKNKDVKVISFENGKNIISVNGTPIIETNFNELKRINFEKAKELPTSFLYYDKDLEEANFPNVLKVSDKAFFTNEKMKFLNIPKAKYIGDFVLYKNKVMEEIYLPSATFIGSNFLLQDAEKKIHISNKLENFNNILLKIQSKTR